MTPHSQLELAAATFVGTHFLLSHPFRGPLVRTVGERVFMILYSLVAIATFAWMIRAYGAIGPEPLRWEPGPALVALASLLMWLGSILFVGSFVRNPAFPHPGAPVRSPSPREPWGVFRITRHPMMWGFGLWGLVHALVNPTESSFVLAEGIVVLALVGAALQDFKKRRLLGARWREWESRTSFFPFASGRFWPGTLPLVVGTLLFLGATWAHAALGARPAGPWALLG